MQAISTQKYIRVSPRKLRLVADMTRKMTPVEALAVLPYVNKAAAIHIEKVVKSAVANAKVMGANEQDLVFKEIQISEGPRLKRGIAVSKGMWHPIVKYMSHIRVIVETKETPVTQKADKKAEVVEAETVEAPVKKTVKAKAPKKGAKKGSK